MSVVHRTKRLVTKSIASFYGKDTARNMRGKKGTPATNKARYVAANAIRRRRKLGHKA